MLPRGRSRRRRRSPSSPGDAAAPAGPGSISPSEGLGGAQRGSEGLGQRFQPRGGRREPRSASPLSISGAADAPWGKKTPRNVEQRESERRGSGCDPARLEVYGTGEEFEELRVKLDSRKPRGQPCEEALPSGHREAVKASTFPSCCWNRWRNCSLLSTSD